MKTAVLTTLAATLFLAVGSSAVAAADPAPAPTQATPAQATAPATPPKKNPADQVICKTEVPIGSRLGGKKVCMTRADWAQQSGDARDSFNHANPSH